jgi:hypothetical protein
VHGAELTGESHGSGGGTYPGKEMRQPVTVVDDQLRRRTRRRSGASKQRKPTREVKLATRSLGGCPIEIEQRKGGSGEGV